jgi:DNA-binding IclR family transcriptional regulator
MKATRAEPDDASTAIKMVKPVVNALQILRHLTATTEPARAVDVARQLGINQSTCFNILRTLVAEDVVDFDPLSKTYTAGIGLADLVGQFVTQGQRIEVAKPLMRDLAGKFAVTVTLWRPIGVDRIVLVSSEVSPTDLRIDMAEGQRLPYLMGASGRIFATQLDLSETGMKHAFNQLRWSEPVTFDAYWREVQDAKKRGYAIDDGNFARGIMAIAAPVRDKSGAIAFTVSAVMFRNQFDKPGIAQLGKALAELGKRLSTVLF